MRSTQKWRRQCDEARAGKTMAGGGGGTLHRAMEINQRRELGMSVEGWAASASGVGVAAGWADPGTGIGVAVGWVALAFSVGVAAG